MNLDQDPFLAVSLYLGTDFGGVNLVAGSDRYRRLFGEMALEKGVINSDQLLQALAAQERLREDGKPVPLLGQILVELGYLTPEKLQELIEFIYPVGDDVHGNDEHGNDKHSADKHSADKHSADKHSADKHSAGEHSDEKMAGSEEA